MKNFFLKYYVTYSGGDVETLLPGTYVIGKVMSNRLWHKNHPGKFESYKNSIKIMSMLDLEKIDDARKKYELEHFYKGKIY